MGGYINGCLSRNYVSSDCITASKTTVLGLGFLFLDALNRHSVKMRDLEFVKGMLFTFERAVSPASKLG